jgi:hypothetical protein
MDIKRMQEGDRLPKGGSGEQHVITFSYIVFPPRVSVEKAEDYRQKFCDDSKWAKLAPHFSKDVKIVAIAIFLPASDECYRYVVVIGVDVTGNPRFITCPVCGRYHCSAADHSQGKCFNDLHTYVHKSIL